MATTMPVPVFAEINETQEVVAENEEIEQEFDENIVVDSEQYALAVVATGEEGAAAVDSKDVINNDMTGEFSSALTAAAEQNGETEVEVEGNVEGGAYAAAGVIAQNGVCDVEVKGNVTSEGKMGLLVDASDDGAASVVVTGDVSGNIKGIQTSAGIKPGSSGMTVISVGGNVTGEFMGVHSLVGEKGLNDVVVRGDVSATGDDFASGVAMFSEGGENTVKTGGDVKGSYAGIVIGTKNNGKNNILVEGTVSGGKYGIVIDGEGDSAPGTITVWKVEKAPDGHVAMKLDSNDPSNEVYTEVPEIEEKIQYIIKIEQPRAGATLTATRADGSALATVTGVAEEPWQWAYEGDKVLLKIDVDSDYTVDAVYGDKGQEYKLVKDGCGNYYIEVPRGGGVYFSAVLSRNSSGEEADNSNPDQKNEWQPPVSEATQAAINAINGTPAGGTASISWTEDRLDAASVNALLARRDITVTLVCLVNGKLVIITIPAGADLSSLVEADGTIQIEKLAAAYGTTDVR